MIEYTPGAIRAAKIIIDSVRILRRSITIVKMLTADEIAETIDRETAAPELLEALEAIVFAANMDCPRTSAWLQLLCTCDKAIAKAKSEE